MRQVSHPEPALGSTIFVTTRPFETIRVDATTDELSLRIERDGLVMPLVWILMVSVALGLFVQLIFPHLPWGNPGVLTKVTSIAWFVSGFSLTLLLTIFSINFARSRPGSVLLRLTRSPDGVRCMHDASETTLTAPTITIGPERDLLAVRDWRTAEHFGDAERAVLAATDDTLQNGTITDESWSACRAALDDDAVLVELVAAIGNWRMFSALLRSLDVPLEDGVEPWPPSGEAPAAVHGGE